MSDRERRGGDPGGKRPWFGGGKTERSRRGRYVARPVESAESPGVGRAQPGRPGRRTVYGAGAGATRSAESLGYLLVFGLIAVGLVAFVYVGLQWATGTGPAAGLSAAIAPKPTPSPSPLPIPSPSPSPAPTAAPTAYTVQAGDNPAEIARQFRVTVEALLAANNIQDPRSLQVGQVLKIPPPGTR
ncbi:MAG: LysM peptidoglycan-binding domain-containing protein [Chloroflexi bacterium]|nr:LysM peptidoglycan-binding domain-containing protein [Chloroflexota bacterium]